MRFVTVYAPDGQGQQVANLALRSGAGKVSIYQVQAFKKEQQAQTEDVVNLEVPTPVAKAFIDNLLTSAFYDPKLYGFSIRAPRSIFATEPPKKITDPFIMPTSDVFEELWQFCQITFSFVGRVYLAALLMAFGMLHRNLPVMLAGLLFLPYQHQLLCISLGAVLREKRFLLQGLLALLISTMLIFLAGLTVGCFTTPPILFDEFGTPIPGMVFAAVVGVAAALAATDDAGRRELIGLAATAQITVYPAWFGLKIMFGISDPAKVTEYMVTFGLKILILMLAAALTFLLLELKGEGIRRFAADFRGRR